MSLTLDTNIILAFSSKEEDKDQKALKKLFSLIKEGQVLAYLSAISVSEIFAVLCREGEARKAAEVVFFVKGIGVQIIDVNENIAKDGGIFKAKYSSAKKSFSY